jgi:hypothetical protein
VGLHAVALPPNLCHETVTNTKKTVKKKKTAKKKILDCFFASFGNKNSECKKQLLNNTSHRG